MTVTEWVQVAHTADIAPGEGFQVEIDNQLIAIWNVNGEFYATSDVCTHEEFYLTEGDLWDEVIECPMHGAQFDVRTGEVLSLPAVFPLPTYPIKVEDGSIYVGWGRSA